MSSSEKDKLGEKLHDVEAARENEWAHQRDQELLEKLRHKASAPSASCPECQSELIPNTDANVGGMVCPQKHGGWFGWDTVIKIMDGFAHTKK